MTFLRSAQVLARMAGEDVVDFILRMARDNPSRIDQASLALKTLFDQPEERVIERLWGHFKKNELGDAVATVLVRIGDASTIERLNTMLQQGLAVDRCVSTLFQLYLRFEQPESSVGTLEQYVTSSEMFEEWILSLLQDQDPKLRMAAAKALVRGYASWPQDVRGLLDVLWHDESFEVRKSLYDSINQHASELPEDIVLRSAELMSSFITAHILDGGVLFGQDTPIRIRVENQSLQPQRNVTFELVETAECRFTSGRKRDIPWLDRGGCAELEFLANARKVSPSIPVSYKVNGILGIDPLYLMSVQGNPYSYGGVTRESLIFYGRGNEVNDILASVVQPKSKMDIFLYGERRAGKTSMLLHLEKLIQPPYVPIFFMFHDLPSEYTSRDVSLLLVKRARDILIECTGLSLEAPSDQDLVLSDAFKGLFQQISDKGYGFRLVLLIDEADEMIELAQREATPVGPNYALAKNIRATLQDLLDVRAVIAGTSKFDSDIVQISSPLFNQLKKVALEPLSVDATQSLIKEPAGKFGRQYETAAVNRIVDLSGGHPYYCQAVCHHAYNEAARKGRNIISVKDVAAAERAVLDELENSFRNAFWDRMTSQEIEFVCAIAAHAKTLPDIPGESIRKLEKDWYLIKPHKKDAAQFEFYADLFAAWIERLCQRRE